MKKIFFALSALTIGCLLRAADSGLPLVFAGVMRTSAGYQFVLTDVRDLASSRWLRVGQSFRDCTVAKFDPETEALAVTTTAGTWLLGLKRDAVKVADSDVVGVKAVILEFGIHVGGESTAESESTDTDSNGQPVGHFNGGHFIRPGARVAVELGNQFGFFARFYGLPASQAVELEFLFATPPMHLPDGRVVSSSYFTAPVQTNENGEIQCHGSSFSFDHDYELVPGRYRMEIRYKSKLLAAQEFDAELPKERPKLANSVTK